MMYRVIAIVGGALALAACSSSPEWMSLDGLKPGPSVDTVRFESEPPGAEAKTSNGQTCRTPCALGLPTESPLTVTFSLNGYLPESETLEPVAQTGSPPALRPNPVQVELTAAPPQAKSAKPARKPVAKPAAKKPTAKKPAAKPAAASPQSSAPAAPAAPAQPAAAAPWPSTPRQ
jgi:hypothetical protein